MKCKTCGSQMNEMYRFTDWYADGNDSYGTLAECKARFDEAVHEEPEGRFSVYNVSECPKCETFEDEGIIFNENCPEYKI